MGETIPRRKGVYGLPLRHGAINVVAEIFTAANGIVTV